jgi:ABC-type dipeptide/oligopeptide/nickel transport system permease subunit
MPAAHRAAEADDSFPAAPGPAVQAPLPPPPAPSVWRRLRRDSSAQAGAILTGAMILAALLAPILSPFDPMEIRRGPEQLAPPGSAGPLASGRQAIHWLGTDPQGRDIWARLLGGARVSLMAGAGASLLAGILGISLGAVAGYKGGWLDALAMRAADIVLAFPRLILAIAILAAAPRPSLWLVAAVLGFTGWAGAARLTRAEVMRARELEYVLAARAAGASDARLLWRHILPSVWGALAIWLALAIPGAMMAEAGLSFLGLGVEPGRPSWGGMMSEVRDYDLLAYWWMPFFPGLALAMSVLGWNLLGQALQEALNPRLASQR